MLRAAAGGLVAILLVGGVLVPVLVMGLLSFFLLAGGVNWPPRSPEDAALVLAHPLFAWPFFTLALMAGMAVIRLVSHPAAALERRVRAQLWLGLAINVQYLLIVAGCMASGRGLVLVLGEVMGAVVFLGLVIMTGWELRSGGLSASSLRTISLRMALGLVVWIGCAALAGMAAALDNGQANELLGAPLLFLGLPHLQIVAFTSALFVVRVQAPATEHRRDMPPWLLAYASGWATSGAALVWAWYFFPMHTRPMSYIATAASRGHRRWVGGRLLKLPDGREIIVNRQLHRLITLELLLAWWSPTVHRPLRGLYDRVGPPLAAGLTNPCLADVAYVVLKPLEWMAAGIGWASLRSARR